MEQQMDLTELEAREIDPETFRRVWERVMPDQRNSPIALGPAVPAPARGGGKKTRPTPARQPVTGASRQPAPSMPRREETVREEKAETEDVVLRRLMDLLQEGAAAGQLMARRAGSQGKTLAGMVADHRKAMRQLSAAYFLATGRRYQPRGGTPSRNSAMDLALREQFQWEQRWIGACLEGAERAEEPTLRELCRELAREGNLHCRAIRGMLERG